MIKKLKQRLNNQHDRDEFVLNELSKLPQNTLILDAGCGSQRYRKHCKHLNYKAQDFAQYTVDSKKMIGSDGVGGSQGYSYGELDYTGNIWEIEEDDETFDAILCTEVLEHIPYPVETISELSRLLKKGGILILTAPSNCLRHMDPYFFYSGFSDRWYEKMLPESGLRIESLEAVGDYYRWLLVEMVRTAKNNSLLSKFLLLPAILYYYSKKTSVKSTDTLCMGYHVIAIKE